MVLDDFVASVLGKELTSVTLVEASDVDLETWVVGTRLFSVVALEVPAKIS